MKRIAPVLLLVSLSYLSAQSTLPLLTTDFGAACSIQQIYHCKNNCNYRYKDPARRTCPCYAKMFQCLVKAGCDRTARTQVLFECTRMGYCRDGYCSYREGDVTPRRQETRGILVDMVTPVAERPCIGGACVLQSRDQALMQTQSSRNYRLDEVLLPSRHGDPRLGVNQHYDGLPYSIPIQDHP